MRKKDEPSSRPLYCQHSVPFGPGTQKCACHGVATAATSNDAIGCGWNDMQIREFAKRFAYANKASWHAYVTDVREALIDSAVLLVVLGQDRAGVKVDVKVDEVRSLRSRLGSCLAAHHRMPNAIAE
jgi:hypothetical protein